MEETAYIQDLRDGSGNPALRFDYFQDGAEIGDSLSVEWGETPIIGRSEPFRHYAGTSKRSLSVNLMFCCSVSDDEYVSLQKTASPYKPNITEFTSVLGPREIGEVRREASANRKMLEERNESMIQLNPSASKNRRSRFINDDIETKPMYRVLRYVNFLRSFLFPVYALNNQQQVFRVDAPPLAYISLAKFLKFKGLVTGVELSWKKPWFSDEDTLPMYAEVSLNFDVVSDIPMGCYQFRENLSVDYFRPARPSFVSNPLTSPSKQKPNAPSAQRSRTPTAKAYRAQKQVKLPEPADPRIRGSKDTGGSTLNDKGY